MHQVSFFSYRNDIFWQNLLKRENKMINAQLNNYKELIELIPLIQENILKSLKKEFKIYEFFEGVIE